MDLTGLASMYVGTCRGINNDLGMIDDRVICRKPQLNIIIKEIYTVY